MKIPVILLNYNSSADCKKCVTFLKQQQGIELEIVIVDNCSQTGDQLKVKELSEEQGCTFIQANENRGYNAGNNIGLRYAAKKGYKYALIANLDMEFPQVDYMAHMLAKMEEDDDIVILGTDIVGPDGIHQNPMVPDGGWLTSFRWITEIGKRKNTSRIDDYRESHYCHKVSGCCMLLRIGFVGEIAYFDEHVFLYCEEAILAKQVEKARKKMYYMADCQAVHRHIKSQKGNPTLRFKAFIKSRLYFEREYNFQGALQHALKILGWRSYQLFFSVINTLRK